MAFLSEIVAYGGLGLQLVALVLLVRGPFSRYFPLFLYLISGIGLTVSLIWVYQTLGVSNELYFSMYWGGELLTDLLLFFLVISLTTRALEGHPMRKQVVRLLTMIMVFALIIPFVTFDSAMFGRRWNQSVSQLFNFGAALMNLALWSALIVSKRRDRQLLMVSAGLGITVAGSALTLGVRQFTHQGDVLRTITDFVYRACQIAGPAMWCWAFRPAKKNGAEAPPAVLTTPSAG